MAGIDGVKIDKPLVLAGATTLADFAATWRQVWDAQAGAIDAIEASDPFGDGEIRAQIDSWYPQASEGLRSSGGKVPPFFETMAANCRIFTGQFDDNDQRLAQQARQALV
jgi:hypothetical protein